MFETINAIVTPLQGSDTAFSSQTNSVKSSETTAPRKPDAASSMGPATAQIQKKAQSDKQATEQMLRELEQDIEAMHSVGLKFAKFDESGRTFIKVIDKTNDEVIREIPSEEVMKLAAKMEEMIGILFDKQV